MLTPFMHDHRAKGQDSFESIVTWLSDHLYEMNRRQEDPLHYSTDTVSNDISYLSDLFDLLDKVAPRRTIWKEGFNGSFLCAVLEVLQL